MHIESRNQNTKRKIETKNILFCFRIKKILEGQFYGEGQFYE